MWSPSEQARSSPASLESFCVSYPVRGQLPSREANGLCAGFRTDPCLRGDRVTQTQDFFSLEAVGQLAGAIAAVTAISVTVRRLTGRDTPLIPFFTSLVVTYLTAGASGGIDAVDWATFPSPGFFHSALTWLLPLLNACLLFTSAIGATEVGGAIGYEARRSRTRRDLQDLSPKGREPALNRTSRRGIDHNYAAPNPAQRASGSSLFRSWLRSG
jgi:hypothetical protein